jgi:hypothetical protein
LIKQFSLLKVNFNDPRPEKSSQAKPSQINQSIKSIHQSINQSPDQIGKSELQYSKKQLINQSINQTKSNQ